MSKLRSKFITVLTLLFCTLLLLSTALFIPKKEKAAEANTISSSLNVPDLISGTGANFKFNGDNLATLYKNLTGSADKAVFSEVEKLVANGNTLTAREIREKASGGNLTDPPKGEFTVNFAGKEWIPTYLSRADGSDGSANTGDVILTLWLAESATDTGSNIQWTGHTSMYSTIPTNLASRPNTYVTGSYSSSYARAYITGYNYSDGQNSCGGTVPQNAGTTYWKSFVADYGAYFVKPINVAWQSTQAATMDFKLGYAPWNLGHLLPNEHCAEMPKDKTAQWYDAVKGITTLGTGTGNFYSWGDDKIWLPSLSETGDYHNGTGIWVLAANQRFNGENTLLRSGHELDAGACSYLTSDGIWMYARVANNQDTDILALKGGIRPAFHLNLTEASKNTASSKNVDKTALPVPSNSITTVYNGKVRTFAGNDGLAAENADNAPWYYSALYQSTAADVTEGEAASKTVKDADTYSFTLTIGNTTDYKWYNATDSTASFTLTIQKKKVKVRFIKQGTNSPFANNSTVKPADTATYPYPDVDWFDTTQIASDDTGDRLPKLKLKYQGRDGTTVASGDEYTAPTLQGKYRATAEIYYDDPTQKVNYELDSNSTTYIDFEIKPVEVTKPTLQNTNLTYNGAEQTVTVSGLPANNSTTGETTITYTVTKDGNVVGDGTPASLENLMGTSFKVIDAGTYKVTFSIVSAKQNTHVWSGENNSSDLEITFTVKKKRLRLYFDGSSDLTSGAWSAGTAVNFSVNLNNDVCTRNGTTEQIVLYVSYTDKDGHGSTEAPDQGGYNYILPSDLVIGSNYVLYCKLADNQPVNDNYVIEDNGNEANEISKGFEITAANSSFTANDLNWVYKNADIAGNAPQSFTAGNRVDYNTKTYTVSLDTSNLAALGIEVDTSYGTNGFDGIMSATDASATAYTISVKIKARSGYTFTGNTLYTFEWYIDPIAFDLSSYTIKWQYKARGNVSDYVNGAPYEGGTDALNDGGKIEIFLSGVPSEFTVKYAEQATYTYFAYDVASYTAKVNKLVSTNCNYKDIDNLSGYSWETQTWEIVQHVLPTTSILWSQAAYSDGHVTAAPELDTMPYNVDLEYKYYDNADCTGNDIAFADLTYTEGQEKIYYVMAFIKNSADMTYWGLDNLSDDSNNPHKFIVGVNRTAVKINVSGGGMYDGTPQGVKIELVGTYQEITLDAFEITYYNSAGGVLTGAPTNVGTYTVKIALKAEFADRYFIKDNADFTLEITTRILEVPTYAGSLTYNGDEQDIAKLVGLPDGWENYLEITINGNSGSKVRDVGTYSVIFKIKQSDIDAGNVAWNATSQKTTPRTLSLTVNQLVLHAKKWSKNGYYTALEFEEEDGDRFVTYTVKDANGNLVTETEFYAHPDDEYVIEVFIGEEHGENVRIEYAGGVNPQLRFIGNSTDEGDAAELENSKNSAKEELEKEAKAKKDAVDTDVNLSPEEKAAAKAEIEKELEEGLDAIDKATDTDGVDKALGDGKKEIDDTADLAKSKGAAKSELDKAAQAKKEAIDNDPDLTDEEKAAAKAEVDKELEEGKKAIDNASSVGDIQSTESTTKTNIENINPEHKGNFPWWILAVIAGAIILLTLIIIVVVKKRNSEDDEGGYDDFYDDEYDYDEEEEVDDDGDEAYGY